MSLNYFFSGEFELAKYINHLPVINMKMLFTIFTILILAIFKNTESGFINKNPFLCSFVFQVSAVERLRTKLSTKLELIVVNRCKQNSQIVLQKHKI